MAEEKSRQGFPLRLFLELFVPVALLIVGGAWFIAHDRISEALDMVRADEANNVVLGVRRLDGELQRPLQQLRELAREPAVQAALAGDDRALRELFRHLVAYNPNYDKLRWIDANGRERLRCERVDGRAVWVAPVRLQDLSGQYYVRATLTLDPGQTFISPLDLNTENGQVEQPYKPVLRLATPLADGQGRRQGMLIINIAASQLLEQFTESIGNKRDHVMLLNAEGYRLQSNDPGRDWGFMFQRKDSLASGATRAWLRITALPSDQIELDGDDANNGLWTWSTAYPLKVPSDGDVRDLPYWLVVSRIPQDQLAWIHQAAWRSVGSAEILLLLVYTGLSYWLARALRERNLAELEVVKAHGETLAAQRLAEANERFHMMVEANANGLLVADNAGRIVFANPALARMFGYDREELLNQSLEMLLPDGSRPAHIGLRNGYLATPQARAMGIGRELLGRRKDGSEFPIEVSLSPFMENGRQFVDALVADLSGRKAPA